MAAKPDRVVLVDGTWLVFRAFFAIPPNLKTARGLHTNAIYGFATMFRKLFSGRRPELGAVVFDADAKLAREEAFAEYKGTRVEMADALVEQLPWIDRLVAANHFPILRSPGWEADDVIGTLAREAEEAGLDVLIVAGDKDFAQLVNERVRMFDPMKDVTYDASLVQKKWGVPPSQIVDLLALMGDTVDNIPGVPGIGQKGATTLLEKYGSIDGIYARLDELAGRQKTTLAENRDAALLSRQLATINRRAPLDRTVLELTIAPPDPDRLDALYRELEFHSLLTTKSAATEESAVGTRILAADDVSTELDALPYTPVAIVPLLDPSDAGAGPLVGLAISASPGSAMYLPISVPPPAGLAEWLTDPARVRVAHDAKTLWKALRRHGLDLGPTEDTMLASFLVDPTKVVPHRLEQVSREYLQHAIPPLKTLVGSGQKELKPSEVPVADAAAYAGQLAETVLRLWDVLAPKMASQEAHYRAVELPLSRVLGQMELDGIQVDRGDLDRMSVEFTTRKEAIEEQIYELAGKRFNIGSTSQLATVLFEDLKLPVIKKTKTGYSTDAEVLEQLAPKHPIARLLLEQRMLAKLINTYTDVLRDAISPTTGRVHATFQQTTGVSGRLISTDPDLQRTPVRTPEGKRIRHAFVAGPGNRLLSADWSQIELRVLAHFSHDARLLEAFAEGRDVHRQAATELFHVPFGDVTPEQRNVGKTVNFATIYGQGATALGQILGIPRKEAQRYIEGWFEAHAGVKAWLDRTVGDALASGSVTTILGRRRYIPELASQSPMDRQAGERIAVNTPIQGSAADLCKLAMLRIAEQLRDRRTRMLLQVHDELVFEVPEDEVADVTAIVRAAMEHPMPLDVPLVVNIGVGPTWGDAH
jgi:DNA polymerase-1